MILNRIDAKKSIDKVAGVIVLTVAGIEYRITERSGKLHIESNADTITAVQVTPSKVEVV